MWIGRSILVASGLGLAVALAGPAAAQECPNAEHAGVVDCPPDPGDPGGSAVESDSEVLGTSQSRGGGLPVTGGDVVSLVVIGGSAIGVGAVLVNGSRRRRVEV